MDWTTLSTYWSNHGNLKVIGIILLGQLLSLTVALMNISSSLIAQFGVDTPLTQNLFTYGPLALVYGSILIYRRQKPLVSWYWYLLLGFADAQGSYFVPWVIILTWFLLGTRYTLWQLCGGALCVTGLSLVLLSDTSVGDGGGSRPILGDVLVIVGTIFYAISNVGEEFCVKKKDRVEVVAMLGVYAFLVTSVELFVLELKTLESIKWSADIVLAFVGYGVSGFMFCSLAPFLLKFSGSTMYNLSLLTANMWVVLFKVFFYHQKVNWLYFLALLVVAIGLVIYSTTEKKVPASATDDENLNTEYQILDGENTTIETNSFVS